jgi:hypothetical protein
MTGKGKFNAAEGSVSIFYFLHEILQTVQGRWHVNLFLVGMGVAKAAAGHHRIDAESGSEFGPSRERAAVLVATEHAHYRGAYRLRQWHCEAG